MKNLKSLRIRNLRSFGDENDFIPLKKLNILVGKNSCGKSTFLRTFPLLRQSVQADTRSPILWYGGLVDFGDLGTAVNFNSEEVLFDFDMMLNIDDEPDFLDRFLYFSGEHSEALPEFYFETKYKPSFPVRFTLGMKKGKGLDAINRIFFEVENVTVEVLYRESEVLHVELKLNGETVVYGFEGAEIQSKGNLIPTDFSSAKSLNSKPGGRPVTRIRTEFRSQLVEFMASMHHLNKKKINLSATTLKLKLLEKGKIYSQLRKVYAGDKAFLKNLELDKEDIVDRVFCYLVGANLHRFLGAIDEALTEFYSGVRYLGPVRASAERFYRYQDLQIAEIDHTGSNLPMVLNSLEAGERDKLNTWISESFGFELKLTNTGSHYALSIRESLGSEYHNVSDMGFGYSQLLPIIVSIWLENQSGRTERNRRKLKGGTSQLVLAIEQPELHLHPELQHKFGRMIAKISKLQDSENFCFVLETHSKHIIDSIGECIEEGEVDNDDVNISLFEKSVDGFTKTSLSMFDDSGYLTDWPAGFLSP
ncbi:AAA family ATPase [Pseudomonas helleri]|jgi:predicted ATPase|uniref:AAA family ATPase n=1 Tax=Pseudomonas helleri TaxID=1608996 RepID=UPI003D0D8DE5